MEQNFRPLIPFLTRIKKSTLRRKKNTSNKRTKRYAKKKA